MNKKILYLAAALACLSLSPALAAAPTATYSGLVPTNGQGGSFDTNRTQPQGASFTTVGDLGVSVAGTSLMALPIAGSTGTATCEGFSTLAAQLQRATVDPNGANKALTVWSSSGSALAANGTTAISEAGVAWYRWNITALTGTGNCVISGASK